MENKLEKLSCKFTNLLKKPIYIRGFQPFGTCVPPKSLFYSFAYLQIIILLLGAPPNRVCYNDNFYFILSRWKTRICLFWREFHLSQYQFIFILMREKTKMGLIWVENLRTPCKQLSYPQGYVYPRLRIADLYISILKSLGTIWSFILRIWFNLHGKSSLSITMCLSISYLNI